MTTTTTTTTTTTDTALATLARAYAANPGDEQARTRYAAALVRAGERADADDHDLWVACNMIRRDLERARWEVIKAEREAEEAALRADPIGQFARVFSAAGPCFVSSGVCGSGRIIKQTAKFYVTQDARGTDKPKRIRKDKVHLRACSSCPGGASYPHGYQD